MPWSARGRGPAELTAYTMGADAKFISTKLGCPAERLRQSLPAMKTGVSDAIMARAASLDAVGLPSEFDGDVDRIRANGNGVVAAGHHPGGDRGEEHRHGRAGGRCR